MSNTVLKSFDPFATHPFTNAVSQKPQSFASAPSSLPNQQTPAPIYSPTPRQAQQQPVFTPFQKDRRSPDLQVDALMKKSTSTQWGKAR